MIELEKFKVFQGLNPSFTWEVSKAFLVGIGTDEWKVQLCLNCDVVAAHPRAGILVMRNEDVYGVANDLYDVKLLGTCLTAGGDVVPSGFPIKIQALCGKGVTNVSSGIAHVVALTRNGHVYCWKKNGVPELVMSTTIMGAKAVKQIACGTCHTVVLDSDGVVYSWGQNTAGQLGSRPVDTPYTKTSPPYYYSSPKKVTFGEDGNAKISQVACGDTTSYALDQKGHVWSWGFSSYGALGYLTDSPQAIPREIEGISSTVIVKVVAGSHHVLTLTQKKSVYFWGQHLNEEITVKPKRVYSSVRGIQGMAATRACPISVCMAGTTVYVLGHWHGRYTKIPIPFSSTCISLAFALASEPMLYEPLVVHEKLPPIQEKWRRTFNWNNADKGGFRFRVQDRFIRAHKDVLEKRSDHFGRMFMGGWLECLNMSASVEKFTYSGFKAFLQYLYTDHFDWESVERTIELVEISDFYGEKELTKCCENLLKSLMTVENICDIYGKAVQYNVESIQNMARKEMLPMLNEVIKSKGFEKLDNKVAVQLTRKLAEENAFIGRKRPRCD